MPATACETSRDPTFTRFADLFHHRALSLLYRAWADVRPAVSFDRPQSDRFATYVGSLAGLGMGSLRGRDAMPDMTKLHFAGLLANQTRHADGLAAILSSFFTVPVQVESFVGSWLTLPPADHTRLAGKPDAATLGAGALLGKRVWSRTHKIRLVFGPLTLASTNGCCLAATVSTSSSRSCGPMPGTCSPGRCSSFCCATRFRIPGWEAWASWAGPRG